MFRSVDREEKIRIKTKNDQACTDDTRGGREHHSTRKHTMRNMRLSPHPPKGGSVNRTTAVVTTHPPRSKSSISVLFIRRTALYLGQLVTTALDDAFDDDLAVLRRPPPPPPDPSFAVARSSCVLLLLRFVVVVALVFFASLSLLVVLPLPPPPDDLDEANKGGCEW